MSLSHSVFDMVHKLFICTIIILLDCVVLWHQICRMIFILHLQWLNLKEISLFFLYSVPICKMMWEGLRCVQNFILTLNPNYYFYPAISQEDVNKVNLRNIYILIYVCLSLCLCPSLMEERIGNKFFNIINSPLELSELYALLVKCRERSSFIYFKSITLKLIFEVVS